MDETNISQPEQSDHQRGLDLLSDYLNGLLFFEGGYGALLKTIDGFVIGVSRDRQSIEYGDIEVWRERDIQIIGTIFRIFEEHKILDEIGGSELGDLMRDIWSNLEL